MHRIRLKTRGWPKYKPVQLIKYFEFIWKAVKLYKKAEIIHCNDLNALPIGVIIKKFFNKNAKIVYDAHEYQTETNGLSNLQKQAVECGIALYQANVIGIYSFFVLMYRTLCATLATGVSWAVLWFTMGSISKPSGYCERF